MNYRLEMFFFSLIGAAILFGSFRAMHGGAAIPAAEDASETTRRWETSMNVDGKSEAPFFITMRQDALGRTTVTCDIPKLGIKDMESDAAIFEYGQLRFRNRLGRFVGHDLGLMMAMEQAEFSVDHAARATATFFCEPLQ